MPAIELKESSGCTKKFHVEIEAERIEGQINETVKTLKKDVQIPGFRKGKAPESMLLKRFGSTIRREAISDLIPGVLDELFKAEGVKPVNEPEIDDLEMDESGPVSFTVAIEEVPEVDASGMEGIVVTKENRKVTDEIVDNEIERIRRMYARQEDVDRPLAKDDIAVINLQKLDDSGVPIVGEKLENHVIALDGRGTPSPQFDQQVIGMSKGEEKRVSFTYDDSIEKEELVGTTEAYDVEMVRIVENVIPELDDEFVKQFGEFENTDAFVENTKERLQAQFDSMSNRKLRGDLIEEFVKQAPFEVPNSMVERVILSEMEQMRRANPNAPFDEEAYRTRMRPDAVRAVQTYVIVDAVKKAQNIEADKDEVTQRIEAAATANGMEAKEFRRRLIKEGSFDDFKSNIAQDKAYDWMISVAKVEEKDIMGFEDQPESNIVAPE